jgi:hypothetical protein
MKIDTRKRRRAAIVAIVALGLVGTVGVGVTGDASARNATVTNWPYQTGSLGGTSETYVDMADDGSYYDPSLGERVFVAK